MKGSHWLAAGILLIFGGVYASISLVNHYFFMTYANDLGIFTQAAYHYSSFEWSVNTVKNPTLQNLLSDHFSLILIPLSFSRYLFGTYGLLIMQIIAWLFGGWGCYKLVKLWKGREAMALLSMLHFFTFLGIITAIGFDYHNNVIGASLVPWFFYFLYKKDTWLSLLFALLIISCKENFGLYMAFIAIGLLIGSPQMRKEKGKLLSFISVFGILYFLMVVKVVMPYLNEGKEYVYFRYEIIGKSWGDGLLNIIKNPLKALKLLFVNHTNDPYFKSVKTDFFLIYLLCGGIFSLLNPKYLPATLFIIFQKMYYNSPVIWGFSAQYSVALSPLLTIALFDALMKVKNSKIQLIASSLAIIATLSSTLYALENTNLHWSNMNRYHFYKSERYTPDYNLDEVYLALDEIPDDAKVSAEFNLVPHLALRDHIYTFPKILDAEYIVLLPNDDHSWPLSHDDYKKRYEALLKKKRKWSVSYSNEDLIILERSSQ